MGKKSKYNKLSYFGKQAADLEMAERYGLDTAQYGNDSRPGQNYNNKKSYEDLRRDVAQAASNDYDLRRTVELAQESGNKKAQKLGQGISNASEAYAATRFMEKTHKNRMDNTGSYDGANDEGNVMNYWKDKVLSKREAAVPQPEAFKQPEAPVDNTPRELSDRGKAAMDTAGDYTFKPVDRGLGNENVAYDPNAGIGDTNAGEFLNNYKKDIQTGIAKDGTPGRGMMSLHNRF